MLAEDVQGDSVQTGNATYLNALTVSNVTQFQQNVSISNNFLVGNSTTLRGNLAVQGDSTQNGNATYLNAFTVSNVAQFQRNVSVSNNLVVGKVSSNGVLTVKVGKIRSTLLTSSRVGIKVSR
jgi:hypothetical protein